MAAVAVELGDQLENAVTFVDFGEPKAGIAMSSNFKLSKYRRPSKKELANFSGGFRKLKTEMSACQIIHTTCEKGILCRLWLADTTRYEAGASWMSI